MIELQFFTCSGGQMASSQSTIKIDPGKSSKKQPSKRRAYQSRSDATDSSDGSDQSANDVKSIASGAWKAPHGDKADVAQYRDWSKWTPGQWAWEFLRRNSDFQKACLNRAVDDASEQSVAAKFHLARFKDFREHYDNDRPLFARSIEVFPRRKVFKDRLENPAKYASSNRPTKTFKPRDNEVVITFRLEPGTHVGTKVLTRQLEQARSRLNEYLFALRKAHVTGSGAQSIDPMELFKTLRAIDLSAVGKSMAEIAAQLGLVKISRDLTPEECHKRQTKAGSKFKRVAMQLAEQGYMKLAASDPGDDDQSKLALE
jgi:hypothetical protein